MTSNLRDFTVQKSAKVVKFLKVWGGGAASCFASLEGPWPNTMTEMDGVIREHEVGLGHTDYLDTLKGVIVHRFLGLEKFTRLNLVQCGSTWFNSPLFRC